MEPLHSLSWGQTNLRTTKTEKDTRDGFRVLVLLWQFSESVLRCLQLATLLPYHIHTCTNTHLVCRKACLSSTQFFHWSFSLKSWELKKNVFLLIGGMRMLDNMITASTLIGTRSQHAHTP